MVEVFLQTLPFFLVIGLGYGAGRSGFFTEVATAWLTKFVFYFALSAMLFKFSANLTFSEVFDVTFVAAYLWATGFVYGVAMMVSFLRGSSIEEAAVEAQCGVIGNVGFLGVPMLTLLMGEAAIGPVMLVLSVDLIIFGSLIVILVTGSRDGAVSAGILRTVGMGLASNPMIVSIVLGLTWSASGVQIPTVMNDFLDLLGGAATPGALFAIGASLATKSAERPLVAGWLSVCKLFLHPAFVAFACLVLFPVDPYAAAVMIAAASLPVAGNVYILAQHYGVAPQRVSASILISTAMAVVTVSVVIGWVAKLY
jgi:predicted permease